HAREGQSEKEEGELDRLGHPGQYRGEGDRAEESPDRAAPLGARAVIHGEAGGRQPEHHHRKEARHEDAGGRIACEEARLIAGDAVVVAERSEEHTSELQSQSNLVCRLLLEKKKKKNKNKNKKKKKKKKKKS